MLKDVKETVTLDGRSFIGEELAMTFSATIPSSTAVSTVNQYVQNVGLYNANKSEVRKDADEFQKSAYEVEDRLESEVEISDLEVSE